MKLIIDEKFDIFANPLKPLIEEVTDNQGNKVKKVRFTGIYMEADIKNKNGRRYPLAEIIREVTSYQPMISEKRALGELEHPESASVNLERACHLCEKLYMEGNASVGQSLVLTDLPLGRIVGSLLMAGVKIGTSSRGLGDLVEESEKDPTVKNFQYVCNDIIHDPSAPRAFINGVLESKEYVLEGGVICERTVSGLEKNLSRLPKKDVNGYLANQISKFLDGVAKRK